MPSAFTRTLRSLELDSYRPAFLLGALAAPLLAAWIAWATTSKAPVYATATTARTEVEGSVIPVDVLDQGRILRSELALGRRVAEGDVLLELDTTMERAKLHELTVKRKSIEKRLEPLRRQKDALLDMFASQRRVGSATVAVAAARAQSAKREASRGEELAAISKKLASEGLDSKISQIETLLAAQRRADSAREGAVEVSRASANMTLELQRLAMQDVELARSLGDAEAELLVADAEIRTLEMQLERHTIRALVAGYLGDVAPVTVGMSVSPGKPLATIIPDARVRMVAYYAPAEAVGRVHEGQPATLRFRAFPWTAFGIAEGRVTSVGVEPRSAEGAESTVRVEIAIDRGSCPRIPVQHGMPATVEILVDRATPWQMLLRTVGGVSTGASDAARSETSKTGGER